jgi:hypothetical protein
MNVRPILNKTAAAAGFAAMLTFAGACAHHNSATADDYGHVATNAPATTASVNGTTPIPGPAAVDSSGNVYTSSAAPGSGNSSSLGTNTDVNNIPKKSSGKTSVTYTNDASLNTTQTSMDTTPAPVVAPLPEVVTTTTTTTTETTPMTSSSTDQTGSMASSTDTTNTTMDTTSSDTTNTDTDTASSDTKTTKHHHHRRMRKD